MSVLSCYVSQPRQVSPTISSVAILAPLIGARLLSYRGIGGAELARLPFEERNFAATTDIVAMAGRYPGSTLDSGVAGLWRTIAAETDLPAEVPLQRWDVDEYFSPGGTDRQLSMYVRLAAFVDCLDEFDATLLRSEAYQLSHARSSSDFKLGMLKTKSMGTTANFVTAHWSCV